MNRISSASWERLLETMRRRVDDTVEELADAVKDAMLDWSPGDFRDTPPQCLAPLDPDCFIGEMRGPVEEVLRQVAAAVNDSPDGHLDSRREEQVSDLFAQLWCEALDVGRQLRERGATGPHDELPPPQGEWARRLRRIVAEDKKAFLQGPERSEDGE